MIRFSFVLLATALAGELLARYLDIMSISSAATVADGVLVVATVVLFRVMTRMEDPQKFTQVYLLSIVAKILLACALIVALILIDKPHARSNVIFLFTMYVLFTIIEVVFLVRLRSTRSEPKKNQKISF